MTDKSCESCDLNSRSRWQNGIGGGEFAGSKVVWVSNTDWKGHISKTITRVVHVQVNAVIYILSSLKMIKYASSFGLLTSQHVGRASGMR